MHDLRFALCLDKSEWHYYNIVKLVNLVKLTILVIHLAIKEAISYAKGGSICKLIYWKQKRIFQN